MDLQALIGLAQLIAMAIAAVWVVAKIGSKTEALAQSIGHLSNSVDRLERTVERNDNSVREMDRRVMHIEAKMNAAGCDPSSIAAAQQKEVQGD